MRRTDRERAITFPWYCHHHEANYCHVSSDTAAPKIYVRAYIDRFLIQVNNVMPLTPFGVISALSSELCIAGGSTGVGLPHLNSEWISILYSNSVIIRSLYTRRKEKFALREDHMGVRFLFPFAFVGLCTLGGIQ